MVAHHYDDSQNASASPRELTRALPVILRFTKKSSKSERTPSRRVTSQRRLAYSNHLTWHGDCTANLNDIVLQHFAAENQQKTRSNVASMNGGTDCHLTKDISTSPSAMGECSEPLYAAPQATLIMNDKRSDSERTGKHATKHSDNHSYPTENQYSSAAFQFLKHFG